MCSVSATLLDWGTFLAIDLSPASVAELHARVVEVLGVRMLRSFPQEGWRSSLLVEHLDGCRSFVLVDHAEPAPRAWPEVELSRIVRSMVRPELEGRWFLSPRIVGPVPVGCRKHTSEHWREQHRVL